MQTMRQQIAQIDAFTDKPFAGNPAGVCLLKKEADESWMRQIAREMNLSETAFLVPQEGGFRLRWFTPTVEVKLCGHATLASAHYLWEEDIVSPEETIRFETLSGPLYASRRGEWIELDFPAKRVSPVPAPDGLLDALGVKGNFIGLNVMDYLVEVESEQIVRTLTPDISLLATLPVRGVIVTAKGTTPEFDFVSRFFAPAAGVPEDPVTGSAHCALGPYWEEKLKMSSFTAYQASARGGVIKVRTEGDRVILGGKAVTVLRCELMV
jgi:PhzF family phenazine biosynthesis protein